MSETIFINEFARPLVRENAQSVLLPIRDLTGREILLEMPTGSIDALMAELSKALASAAMIYKCNPKSVTDNKFIDQTLDVVSVGVSYQQDDQVVCLKVDTTDKQQVLLQLSARVFDELMRVDNQHKSIQETPGEQ